MFMFLKSVHSVNPSPTASLSQCVIKMYRYQMNSVRDGAVAITTDKWLLSVYIN